MFTAAFSLKSIILFLQSNFNAQSSFFAFYDAPLKRQKRRPLRVPSRQHCHGHHPNHGDPEMKNLLTYRYRQRSAISFFNYIISISWPNWYSKYQLVVEVPIGTRITNRHSKYRLVYQLVFEITFGYYKKVMKVIFSISQSKHLNFNTSTNMVSIKKNNLRGIPNKCRQCIFWPIFVRLLFSAKWSRSKSRSRKPTFSTIYVGTKVPLDAKSAKMSKKIILFWIAVLSGRL
jgi:hypothetical protein